MIAGMVSFRIFCIGKPKLFFILVLVFRTICLHSIDIERFEHIDSRNGLSQNSVLSMYCDYLGYMWFGTMDGLNRYDGYTFKIYKAEEGKVNSLTHNRIAGFWEDSLNYLWIKTYEGYYHYYIRESEEFITFPYYNRSQEEKNSSINCFFQPEKTEIWLGSSSSGAYYLKYDTIHRQYRSTQFLSRGISSITNNNVHFIVCDRNRNIWIGTHRGLNYLKRTEFGKELPSIRHLFANYQFNCALLKDSILYFGTRGNGILIQHNMSGKFESSGDALKLLENSDIIFIRQNKNRNILIIGTANKGIYLYNLANKHLVNFRQSGLQVRLIFEDSYGMVWFKTEKFGISRIDPLNAEIKHYELTPAEIQPVIDDERPFLYEDSSGDLWIGTHGGGLSWYDRIRDNFVFYRNIPNSPNTISSNFVHCITEDKSGMLWVGTGQFNGGINKVITANPAFQQILPKKELDDLADNVIRCLFQDSNGFIWMATKSGVIYIYTPDYVLFTVLNYLPLVRENVPGYNVYTILEDSDGFIWLGSKGGGIAVSNRPISDDLAFYKKLRFSLYKHEPENTHSLSNNFVYSVFQDSKKTIWIGTYGGGLNKVLSRNPENLVCKRFNTQNSLISSNDVRYILEDSENRLWIATTFGLNLIEDLNGAMDSPVFRTFLNNPQDMQSISYNDIIHIFEDSEKRLWFGTFGGGVNLLKELNEKKASFRHFRKTDGLIDDAVFAILEDRSGNIWFSTEKGISMYRKPASEFENYDRNSGLYSENFSENTCCLDRDGKMLFGSINGTLKINPEQQNKNQYIPPVVLTNFQLFNRNVDFRDPESPIRSAIETLDTIVLKHYQSSFSFEYAALSYFAPDQNKYSFILENFEKSWNDLNNQRKATYTNLSPGDYVFKVKASSWDGTWNRNPRTVYIKILPPWWKSKTAYTVYFILAVLILLISRKLFLNYYRLQNDLKVERRVNDIKLQFFTNISHEIRTPLTLILGPIEDIKSIKNLPGIIHDKIVIMERNGKRMLRLVNQLLDFRKIQKNKMHLKIQQIDLVEFVKEIYEHFLPIATHKNIDFRFVTSISRLMVFVDPNKFDSVVFNILSNAFKYTGSGKSIQLTIIRPDNTHAEVTVTDQGSGIPVEKLNMIFERFTPLSESTSALEGTGIGLNLSYEIMKLHKGDIFVDTEQGKGSSFRIQLQLGRTHFKNVDLGLAIDRPRVEHPEVFETLDDQNGIPELQKTADRSPNKILIVEDNEEIILYLKEDLSTYFEVATAANGNEALEKIKSFHPDIIVTDIMMPGIDGIEMTKRLKENIETSHIPVVMLTAKSAIEDQIIGIESGAEAYLLKPFNTQYLLAVVRNLLRQRKYVIRKYRDKFEDIAELKITPKDDEFMKNIVQIIETHYNDPEFNVERLAEFSTVSRTVMYNKLKGLTGLSPVDFLRQMRLRFAATILKQSGRNVSETAYLTGFNDVKYFSRCFKELFGSSPRDYKNAVMGGLKSPV